MIKFFFLLIFISIQFCNVSSNLRTSFDPFTTLTNQFLRTIQPNTTALNVSLNLFILQNTTVKDGMQIFLTYWRPYLGYLILIIIGILFLVCFTLTGLFFCCCRVCCNRCGANTSSRATKNLKNIRIAFNIFLFIFVSMILVGAIIAMASCFIFLEATNRMDKTSDLNGNILYGINSTFTSINKYVNTTAQNILNDGINFIRASFNQAISNFNAVISTFIRTYMQGIDFFKLTTVKNNLTLQYVKIPPITVNLANSAEVHETRSNNFSAYLNNLVNVINSTFTDQVCNNSDLCDNLKADLNLLILGFNMTNINYNGDKSAPNITSSYNFTNFENAWGEVSTSAANVLDNVNVTFTGFIKDLINVLNGSYIISNIISFVNNSILPFQNRFSEYQNTIFSYKLGSETVANGGLYNYVYYGFCGLCGLIGVILLIILLFYIGLSFGVCGAPNFEDPACCNKGVGSGFLMAAIGISFIFGWLIMLVTMSLFLSGGVATTEVCSYLNSNDAQQISVVDYLITYYLQSTPLVIGDLTLPKINLFESLMLRCPNSTNLTSAFQIPSAFLQNMKTVIYQLYAEKPVNDTIAHIFNLSISPINTTNLEKNIINLTQLVQEWQTIVSPDSVVELGKPVTKLRNTQLFISNVNLLVVVLNRLNYSETSIRVNNTIYDFNDQINAMEIARNAYLSNKILFESSVKGLNISVLEMSNTLNSLKSSLLNAKNLAISATQTELKDTTKTVIDRTVTGFINAIGDCKGLHESFRSGIDTACKLTLAPLNNIWMGLGWFLLFIIPAIILAVKLSSIYRISHIESESAAYNHAYMASNQFLSRNDLEMIRLGRPQRI